MTTTTRPPTQDDFEREMKRRREEKAEKTVDVKVTKSEPVEKTVDVKAVEQKPESRAVLADRETCIQRGQEAWKRHKADATYTDWLAIGEALSIGRTEAMSKTKSNQPKGRGYNEAFGTWLIERKFSDIDQSDRKRLFDILEHRAEIEAWRAKLEKTQRLRINHPSAIWRKFKADTETPAQKKAKAAKKQARIEKQEGEQQQQPITLKDAILKIADLEGQLEEANGARDTNDVAGGKPLTLDQLSDALVPLLLAKSNNERFKFLLELSKKVHPSWIKKELQQLQKSRRSK